MVSRALDYSWMPETVEEATHAFPRNPDYWNKFFIDTYTLLRDARTGGDQDKGDKITNEISVFNYLNTLIIANRMIQGARYSISLLTDNDADGLLRVLTKNLRQNHREYKSRGTDIRVISLNESYPNRLRNHRDISQFSSAKLKEPGNTPPFFYPFLICDDFLLNIKTSPEELKNSRIHDNKAHFSTDARYTREIYQRRFDILWYRLRPEEKPTPKPKLSRILNILFE